MPSRTDLHDERAAKRRKVRKGTQSCWECKKRKVRCIWAITNTTCDNCSRRRKTCISQEYPDEPALDTRVADGGVEDRLTRVEDLLERLVNTTTHTSRITLEEHPDTAITNRFENPSSIRPAAYKDYARNVNITPSTSPGATSTPKSLSQASEPFCSRYTGISRDLVAAWPTTQDFDYICKLPVGLSTHLHIKLTSSSTKVMSQVPKNPWEMLQLPLPGSHTVLLARKLLLLSSLLQGALSAGQIPQNQRGHFNIVMSHALNTAVRFVTSNEELTASVEGIECIMIEAMIQNYAGNLHRAWMSVRRASAVAQMLGLHRGSSKLSSFKVLVPETRLEFDPDQLCCRIIEMDRYLSLTLGLPQSSLQTRGFDTETMAACHPLDRIARLQCIIADHVILSRVGDPGERDTKNVRKIDEMLKEAATLMPSQWWLAPDFDANDLTAPNPLPEIARTMYQLSHFHLVIRLHLPYVLRSSGNSMCEHSKTTAIHAAREIISRYIAFRKWNTGLYYCRGVDFLSFIALTVLCLAHIDARNQPIAQHEAVLDHSRPSDRAMMERTVEILEDMKDDAIGMKLSRIMQYLLEAEAASADGIGYNTSTSEADDGLVTECDGQFLDGENGVLQLQIPYFGTITLQRRPASSTTTTAVMMPTQTAEHAQPSFAGWDNQWSLLDSSNDMDSLDDWTLRSINEGLFGGLLSGLASADFDSELSLDCVNDRTQFLLRMEESDIQYRHAGGEGAGGK